MPSLLARFRLLGLLAAVTSALVACRDRDAGRAAPATPMVTHVRSASTPSDVLGPGDVRIVTSDSGIDLALIGDSISTGLSSVALEKVRRATDTAAAGETGFGASIGKLVKGVVAGAIGTRVVFPLSAVREVRYEQGRLVFDWTGRPLDLFTHAQVHGHPVLESFRPEDARRFVDAVRVRKTGRPTSP